MHAGCAHAQVAQPDAHVVQVCDVVLGHVVSRCGEAQVAIATLPGSAMFIVLRAPRLVLCHELLVFGYGILWTECGFMGGARKSVAEKLEETRRSWERTLLEEVRAKRSQEQETVRGFHAGQNDVGGHEFRESSCIHDITAIGNGCWQSSAMDHKCGAGIIG